jgi:hypothetical protein
MEVPASNGRAETARKYFINQMIFFIIGMYIKQG